MTTPLSTSEPNRLREELGENRRARSSGRCSRRDRRTPVSPQTRAKVLAGLGLAAGSTALFTGSAAAASVAASTVGKLTWTKLLLGVSLVGVVTAVPVGYYALRHPAPPAGTPARRGDRFDADRGRTVRPQLLRQAAATPAAALLTEELGALDQARLALVNGDGRRDARRAGCV